MFIKAKPIWVKNSNKDYNNLFGFTLRFYAGKGKHILKIAVADCYQAFINGEFALAGPARTASGYSRLDQIEIKVKDGENILAVLVAEYNVNSFEYAPESGFLQAEIVCGEQVCVATDQNTSVFEVFERAQRVQRYSFQRAFTEYWKISENFYEVYQGRRRSKHYFAEVVKPRKILPRMSSIPKFKNISAKIISSGTMRSGVPYKNDPILCAPPFFFFFSVFKTYDEDLLEVDLVHELRGFKTETFDNKAKGNILFEGEFRIFDVGVDGCGFIDIAMRAEQDSIVYVLFDEILIDGDVDFFRLNCVNCIKYSMKRGQYQVLSLEPYCFRYAKVYCLSGNIKIQGFFLKELANPDADNFIFVNKNEGLQKIFEAALNTFRYNAIDILMDCPSRERAGWLCDGYFTGKAERVLTGDNKIEHDFLENFILKDTYEHLPKEMVPMCYPGEHTDGNYIPTWAMWYILELHRYVQDSGDLHMATRSEKKVRGLLKFFEQYENECGLLENLDGWVFIEWSEAAAYASGVSFCANMLYALALQRVGELYADVECFGKAQNIRETIRKQSFNGLFFADHALRDKDGKLVLYPDISEVCQYYAFFTGTATVELFPNLWKILLNDFGPQRRKENKYPGVCFANAFIGNFLRLHLLYENGYRDQFLKECFDYFLYMAERTNTLWEHDSIKASCCHGFASYVTYWLASYNENSEIL